MSEPKEFVVEVALKSPNIHLFSFIAFTVGKAHTELSHPHWDPESNPLQYPHVWVEMMPLYSISKLNGH